MRNPNGYGCIKHLSGRRRRPFVFVVTDEGRQRPVEYFTNLVDAQIFQADYHRAHHHRSLPGHKITFAELYHRLASTAYGGYPAITIDTEQLPQCVSASIYAPQNACRGPALCRLSASH